MLKIPPQIRDHITRHAQSTYPLECCGILLGRPNPESQPEILQALPAENLASPETRHNRYLIDPRILQADLTAQKSNLEILGFYHSHPNHPPTPSPTDNALAWPDYLYLICSLTPPAPPELRAWHLEKNTGTLTELSVVLGVPPLGGVVGGIR